MIMGLLSLYSVLLFSFSDEFSKSFEVFINTGCFIDKPLTEALK